MTEAPHVVGSRLGVVIGSSLARNPFPVVAQVEVEVRGGNGAEHAVTLDDCGECVVLLRHDSDGRVPAHLVDHHAHVRALCAIGCNRVLALGSGGGLRADLGPGTVIVPDDFVALTTYPTFHATTEGYAMPGFDREWRGRVVEAWRATTTTAVVDGGVYAMVRGPRFETKAEIRVLATHADIVGMTIPAECILAGEAGLAYAAVCRIDNLANGIAEHELSVEEYRANVRVQAEQLTADLRAVVANLTG
jgi:5'-methylthioadenosine phosphorylase